MMKAWKPGNLSGCIRNPTKIKFEIADILRQTHIGEAPDFWMNNTQRLLEIEIPPNNCFSNFGTL